MATPPDADDDGDIIDDSAATLPGDASGGGVSGGSVAQKRVGQAQPPRFDHTGATVPATGKAADPRTLEGVIEAYAESPLAAAVAAELADAAAAERPSSAAADAAAAVERFPTPFGTQLAVLTSRAALNNRRAPEATFAKLGQVRIEAPEERSPLFEEPSTSERPARHTTTTVFELRT